ncbi:MAG: nitroreductase [Rhodocyclaceae bacterium]|nr:MAG: nitroreductase [Rhodocyclaceae bacterium]
MHLQDAGLNIFETILARRSVRSYGGGSLDRRTINTLLEAAVRAPTSKHAEPWAFVIVQDRQLLQRLSERAKPRFAEELRRAGVAPTDQYFETCPGPDSNLFYDAGTLILICAKPLGPFVTADSWLAAGNLMLAASAIGLGSCVIGSAVPALNVPEIKSELGIPAEYSTVAPIIVGHPRGETPMSSRREPLILAWLSGADDLHHQPAASSPDAHAAWQARSGSVSNAARAGAELKALRRP